MGDARSPHNAGNLSLEPKKTTVDQVYGSGGFDFLANGFKPREAFDTMNVSGQIDIFAAFAEKPLKHAKGR